MKANCINCGAEFEKVKFSKTCSPACSHEYSKAAKLEYYHRYKDKITSARNDDLNARRNERGQLVGNCAICGSEFVLVGNRRTCSPECSADYHNAKRRAQRAGGHIPTAKPVKSERNPHPAWTEPHTHETQAERDRATYLEAAWIMEQV